MPHLIAGIDEAGYGPILGPLVVGCYALEVPDADADPWDVLRRRVSKRKTAGRTHVADSKKVHSPAAGLAPLETATLPLIAAAHGKPATLDALLAAVAPGADAAEPWEAAADGELFPLVAGNAALIDANALAAEMTRVGVRAAACRAEVLHVSAYNRMAGATRNKAAVLTSLAMRHVDRLLAEHPDASITLDRHGGRSRYGPLLREMFPDRPLAVVAEADSRSVYELGDATLTFAEKADRDHFVVAAASMVSKYLREAAMRRLNTWWADKVPGVKPTAGYWTDGLRFLGDVAAAREELGIDESRLRRVR